MFVRGPGSNPLTFDKISSSSIQDAVTLLVRQIQILKSRGGRRIKKIMMY